MSPQQEVYACKIMKKKELMVEHRQRKLEKEIAIQRSLEHKNITQLISFFEDDHNMYLLLEYCPY